MTVTTQLPRHRAEKSKHSDHPTSVRMIAFRFACVMLLSLHIVLPVRAQAQAQTRVKIDLAIVDGKIRTMDAAQPEATALAAYQGRIVAVGNNADILKLVTENPSTKLLVAEGRLVLPGFNDSHVHFLAGGTQLSSVQLRDAKTKEEFVDRIAAFAKKLPAGQWITGGDWDHENWPSGELPTREWIDAVTPDHPVFVRRLDGHMALANSLALAKGKINAQSSDPPGGLIVRDARNEPTGVLKDAAMNAVYAAIPDATREVRLAAARAATDHAASLGVTSVQDMSGDGDVLIYKELARAGELKTRIYAAAPLPAWQRSAERGLKAAQGDAWIRQGALKGFADGSLGSTTAFFFEPYVDNPNTSGLPSDEMFPSTAMQQRAIDADKAGLQLMIHAIGDRANDSILSVYEELARKNGEKDRRSRIEHAQHLRLADIARFASGKVIASMQPYHAADDGRWAEKRIGPARAKGTYAFRSLLDAGAVLAFGSDWNVAPLDPIQGIAAAVTRRTLDGKHPEGWVPEQKISVQEAVYAYTMGSAFAEFTERDKGSISVGKLADIVVLTDDIFSIPPEKIADAKVWKTIVDGRIVYEKK